MDTSKIIKGVVNSGRYTVTAPIVKEDYGLYLQIEGVELPSTYEVDFSNSEHSGTSVTMIGNADGVLIPHQFIDTGKDVFAFLYHVGADFGRTVYKFRIPNKCRPDRTDEQPTPTQQSVIDQAISALNSAVAQTAQDVIDADASAQSASDDADRAEQAKNDASTFAQRSAQSAQASADYSESAQASASASANSASQSAQIKEDVESMVDDAQGYANSASQSATASANSASQASSSATSASQSASSASGYATSAQTSAQTATAKANEASTSAQTASTKASEASGYATTASNKATEASGYATSAQTAQGLAESARDSAISAKDDAEDARDEAQTLVDSITGKVEQIDSNTERIESLEDDRYKPYPTDTASGAVASFTDGADNIPLKSLIVNINPVQDLSSGDPSPENICPISGWEGCEVNATNTNLCGGSKLLANAQNYILNGTTNTEEEYFQFSSGASVDYDYRFSSGVQFKENTRYTFIFTIYKTTGTGSNMRVNYTDGSYSVIPFVSSAGVKETVVYTSPSGRTVSNVTKANNSGNTRLYYNESGIFEGVLTADQFKQFGKSIPISWQSEAGTVYGGKLDVLTGKLTITHGTIDLGSLTWSYYADKMMFLSSIPTMENPESASVGNITCEGYKTYSYNGVYADTSITGIAGRAKTATKGLAVRDTRFGSDTAAFKSAASGIMATYPLATPTEVQLDAHTLNSLYGQNNIWSDTGDCTVEYRADTKLYIEKLTQLEEDDMIADSAITSGQFFMVGNSLYRALANIASGATITVGTNAERVSLADALNLVNA